MKRRNFIKNTLTVSSALPLMNFTPAFKNNMKIKIMATNWGFDGSTAEFCKKAKEAGYDGVELWWPTTPAAKDDLFENLQKNGLTIAFLIAGQGADFQKNLEQFEKNLEELAQALPVKPLYINCHSGKDFFSFEQNERFIKATTKSTQETGLKIYHETHRGRMCFAAHITQKFLAANPEMQLTLDISHWTNVHESLLEDQPAAVAAALARTRHIHARIGHQEGPQVNDPRAPEWASTLEQHFKWWDTVVAQRMADGDQTMTFLTEFGPPNYMPTTPYDRRALANLWEVNVHMLHLLRKRYT